MHNLREPHFTKRATTTKLHRYRTNTLSSQSSPRTRRDTATMRTHTNATTTDQRRQLQILFGKHWQQRRSCTYSMPTYFPYNMLHTDARRRGKHVPRRQLRTHITLTIMATKRRMQWRPHTDTPMEILAYQITRCCSTSIKPTTILHRRPRSGRDRTYISYNRTTTTINTRATTTSTHDD